MVLRKVIVRSATVVVCLVAGGALVACGDDDTRPADPTDVTDLTPLTVQQLLERSSDTPVDVQGLLYLDGDTARLCDAILESYPPQCGEPSVELSGLDLASVEGTTTEGAITWKERAVLRVQYSLDGPFVVLDVVG